MPEDSTATDRATEPARVSMRQGFGGFSGSSSRRRASEDEEEDSPKPDRSSPRDDDPEAVPEAEAASSAEPAKPAAAPGKSAATTSKKSAKSSQQAESKSQDIRISLNLSEDEYDSLSDLHLAWLQNNRELAKQIGGMKHMTTFALACMQMGANLATSSDKWAKELQKHAPTRRRKGRG